METHNHQKLLFVSIFTLITFNSANAKCVPINSTRPNPSPSPSRHASPISQQLSSQKSFSVPKSNFNAPPKSHFPILSGSSMVEADPQSTHVDSALKKICDSTDYPALCVSSISPFHLGKIDLVSVVEIAIKAATEHTKLAISAATKFYTSGGISPEMQSIIGDCKSSFNDALDNFQKAAAALLTHDVGTMNSMLSAAITDFGDCEDELAGKSPTPLSEFHEKLTDLTSNCLAIVSLIK